MSKAGRRLWVGVGQGAGEPTKYNEDNFIIVEVKGKLREHTIQVVVLARAGKSGGLIFVWGHLSPIHSSAHKLCTSRQQL